MEQQKRVFLPLSTRARTPRVAILGYTELGRALEACFNKDEINLFIADDSFNVGVDEVMDFNPDLCLLCYDFEIHSSGRMEASLIEDAYLKILRRTKSAIALCSDVTPEIMERMCNTIDDPEDVNRFINWPCLSPVDSLVTSIRQPAFQVMGGPLESINDFRHFLNYYSNIVSPNPVTCNPIEATYIKCMISCFLSLKTMFVNTMYDSMQLEFPDKMNKQVIMKAFGSDPRINTVNSRLQNTEGMRGLTEKDQNLLEAFLGFSANYPMLEEALKAQKNLCSKTDEEIELEDVEGEKNVDNE